MKTKSENSTKKTTKKTNGYTLVYFGAGWDFKPVSDSTYSKFNHFVFIDALPKLSHYEPDMFGYEKSKDRRSFIKTLKKYAEEHNMILTSIRKNLLTFKNGDRRIEYYINTTVEEALNNKTIRRKINKAKWVHEEGFWPYAYG